MYIGFYTDDCKGVGVEYIFETKGEVKGKD